MDIMSETGLWSGCRDPTESTERHWTRQCTGGGFSARKFVSLQICKLMYCTVV